MTARNDIDQVLIEWLTATAHVAEPEGLHAGVSRRIRSIRQRPAWLTGRTARGYGHTDRSGARRLTLVAGVGAVVVAGLVWSVLPGAVVPSPSASPDVVVPPSPTAPSPTAPSTEAPPSPGAERTEWFRVPFEYAIPAGRGLVPAGGGPHRAMIAWIVGPDLPASGDDSPLYGGQGVGSGNTAGIVVAAPISPWSYDPAGRLALRTTAPDFMADLSSASNVDVGLRSDLRVDGWPAVQATVLASDFNIVQVEGSMTGFPTGPRVVLGVPSRITALNVGDELVFIQAWARTQTELDLFMPAAHQFVESIHFVDAPAPPVVSGRQEMPSFVRPFEYTLPAESGLRLGAGEPTENVVAWVDGPDRADPNEGYLYGGQGPTTGNRGGVLIASSSAPWSHAGDRYFMRTAPEEFLDDLRERSGVKLGPIAETELDGIPAVAAVNLEAAGNDVHITGPIDGLSQGPHALTSVPSRLIVFRLDDSVAFVQIWARTNEDLQAFMPTAMEFVDSIHFVAQ